MTKMHIAVLGIAAAMWAAVSLPLPAQKVPVDRSVPVSKVQASSVAASSHAAPQRQPKDFAAMKALYAEAYRHFREERGLQLADSLYRMAMAAGETGMAVQSLTIPMKYECDRDNNFERVEQATGRIMEEARKYNHMDYFYSGVSHRVTYFINHAMYARAISYQQEMLDFARKRGDSYGLVIGHISMGNLYRRRLHMAQAIDQYRQALDAYRKYGIAHDLGIDYKRIAECYIIVGDFKRVVEVADAGIASTEMEASVSGLHGYKAFALFMLGRDREFLEAYAKYSSYKSKTPDVIPFIAHCLETMMMIHDGRDAEVEEALAQPGIGKMGAFKTYVEIAYCERKGLLARQLEAMRRMNISLYGDSRGTFAADWARTGAMVNNNLAELDRQRAANVNARLELVNVDLELRSASLQLSHARDAERLALMDAETKRLSLNNQRLLSRQLRDSLATQQLRRKAQDQELRSGRVQFLTVLSTIAVLILTAYYFLKRNVKMMRQLKHANRDLKQTLADLSVASEQAQESDRKKTQFIQNMSHEIRTPLNAIVGFSQVLTDQDDMLDDSERDNMTRIINNNSDVLNTLVNDILDLTSIESGKYVMKSETVCVNELCLRALDATRPRKADGVSLRLETDLPDSFTVTSDEFRLQQVLTNMLTNAMKNTTEGSIVLACSLTERVGMLTFTVTDTGIGVPRDKHKAIFERFCKLDQFKQGVGLGLDICRIIATKFGGAIDIDPNYTNGARFWFAIPV